MMNETVFLPKVKANFLNLSAINAENKNVAEHSNDNLTSTIKNIREYFNAQRYWKLHDGRLILDTKTKLLWSYFDISYTIEEYLSTVNPSRIIEAAGLEDVGEWLYPTETEIDELDSIMPWKCDNSEIFRLPNGIKKIPLTNIQNSDIKSVLSNIAVTQNDSGLSLAELIVNNFPKIGDLIRHSTLKSAIANINLPSPVLTCYTRHLSNKNELEILDFIDLMNWDLYPPSSGDVAKFQSFFNDVNMIIKNEDLNSFEREDEKIIAYWKKIDNINSRLPIIDNLRFTDQNQGLWEFYCPDGLKDTRIAIPNIENIRARNPELDIKDAKVAIDFGTSSTVVAIRQNGKDELLRIGMQESDYKEKQITEAQFENPTILEILDLKNLLERWRSEAYRPLVDWNDVHCSHEARQRLRTNETDTKVIGSILTRLKQWALRDIESFKIKLTDQQDHPEYDIQPLQKLEPIKGQMLELTEDYPEFDPIEMYAWFLGMNINWRERGIFLNYFMTFPVAYPTDVKEKLLSSFRRGLQRSLPDSLITSERFKDFSVTELGSEPSAFAAAALPTLEIEPTEAGVAYAVFDFGGGTTDFDYGIYRLPTKNEYEEGYDEIIEHFGASGDKFLGGENILENLAYQVFCQNKDICLDKEIGFTKPLDADNFIGSERLIVNTQAALTNTTIMMSKLRAFWESDEKELAGEMSVDLLNRQGTKINCTFRLEESELFDFLYTRLEKGLINFFIAMNQSFKKNLGELPQEIHIILAGNSSRSKLLQNLLGEIKDKRFIELDDDFLDELVKIFIEEYKSGDEYNCDNYANLPNFIIHLPLQSDLENIFQPNTKTGVALGLLKISPGESLLVINRSQAQQNDSEEGSTDSPFQYYVGTHRRNIFEPKLMRGDRYHQWVELGLVRQGVFPLLYSSEPQSINQALRGTAGLQEREFKFEGEANKGKKVFGRIIGTNKIEICMANNAEEISETFEISEVKLG